METSERNDDGGTGDLDRDGGSGVRGPEVLRVGDQVEDGEMPSQEELAAMAAMLRGGQGWQPACCQCVSNHKLGIQRMQEKLKAAEVVPGHPSYLPMMQQAVQVGEALAQNPQLASQVTDYIPAIRPADVIANGSSLCLVCFVPAKPGGGLLAAGSPLVAAGNSGWRG